MAEEKARAYPEEDELVLCTVKKIEKTEVFVNIEKYNLEGVIQFSEVAPGRIRNIRDYVTPGKKIVCKVLRVQKEKGHIDLSLRRVSAKERDAVMKSYMAEQDARNLLKAILKENFDNIANKILEKYQSFTAFLAELSKSQKAASELGIKQETVKEIIRESERRQKKSNIKTVLELEAFTLSSDGIFLLTDMFKKMTETAEIKYISPPKYLVVIEGKTAQDINKKRAALESIIKNYSTKFETLKLIEKSL